MVDIHYFLPTLLYWGGPPYKSDGARPTLAQSAFDLKFMVLLACCQVPTKFPVLLAVKDCVLDMCVDEHFQSQTLLEHCAQLYS